MKVLATSLCLLSAAVSSCAGFTLEEAAATSQETEREAKMLFSNSALNMMAINELRERLDRLEAEIHREYRQGPEVADLEEREERMLGDVRVNFTTAFSNITNLYSKVKALRAANKLKCSVKKCDNIRTKVKKVNNELSFLKNVNVTALNETITTIVSFQTTISNLETSVTSLTATQATQQTAIDSAATKVSSLESTVATLQPEVTSNTEKITKVNNCFADINSADCPSARYRTGKSAEQQSAGEEELDTAASRSYLDDVGQYDNDDGFELDPSSLLRRIFRFRRDTSSRRKKNKAKKKKKAAAAGVSPASARSTTPLVPQLRILLACMADSAASTCTAQYSASSSIPGQLGTVTTLTSDLSTVKSCFTDPTAAACTATYSASSTLPGSLATATSDLTTTKACLTDPSASACTGTYSGASSMPGLASSVSTLSSDLTVVKACMTSPSASSCTATYSAATTLAQLAATMGSCFTDPTASSCTTTYSGSSTLPQVLAAKCSSSTCSTLTSDMTVAKACLTDPSASGCTGTYSSSSTLAAIATNVDKCMTSVEHATCTSSYGASTYLTTSGGKGMVGYIQQHNKPSLLSCYLTATVEDYAESSGNNGCTVQLGNWAPLTWSCTQTAQPGTSKDKYYMQIDSTNSIVTINVAGYYKIELTAMMSLNKFQHRIEVYKKSSGATCDKDTVILGLYARDHVNTETVRKERNTNAEGVFSLAASDELIVIASTSGNVATTNTDTRVDGDSAIYKTSWVITRVNY